MATITAFSPSSYYARANGSPLDDSEVYLDFELNLPLTTGVHLSQTPRNQAAGTLIPALQSHIAHRDIFIRALINGEIPPISPLSSQDVPLVTLSPSLGLLHASSSSVLEFLGLVHPLTNLASTQQRRLCPGCGRELERALTTAAIIETLTERLRDEKVVMNLRGPSPSVTAWGSAKGFTAQTSGEQESTISLDTFQCDAPSIQMRAPLIRSALQVSGAFLETLTARTKLRFALGGWCETCSEPAPPLSRRDIESALRRGQGDGLLVMVHSVPLRDYITLPVEKLITSCPLEEPVATALLPQLARVGLGTLPLGAALSSVSIHHLATLIALRLLNDQPSEATVAFLDIPRTVLPQRRLEEIQAVAPQPSHSRTMVWLGGSDETTTISHEDLTQRGRTALGRLSSSECSNSSFEISVDSVTWISPLSSHDTRRHALAIERALVGASDTPWVFESARSVAAQAVECFARPTTSSRLVAHDIGVLDPLAKMYSASHQAKMLGIQAKDFLIGQAKQTKYVCPDCKGAGVKIARDTYSALPAISPCLHCWGTRFRSPVKEVAFKGKTLAEILNSTLRLCSPTLQSLPKMTAVPELAELLGLASIPMGMPVAALTPTETRRLTILRWMLAATSSTPSVIVLEEPFVGLAQAEADGLIAALRHPSTRGRLAWIIVSSRET